MDKKQQAAARLVERLKTEGKISSMAAHSMNNAIVSGFDTFSKQYPDVVSQMPTVESTVRKMRMPKSDARQDERKE